jgi:hypothetical protein
MDQTRSDLRTGVDIQDLVMGKNDLARLIGDLDPNSAKLWKDLAKQVLSQTEVSCIRT